MSNLDTRVAAFVEYVARPLVEDIRLILEQLKSLNIGITDALIKDAVLGLGCWHLLGELIRAGTYLGVTWCICQTVRAIL